MSRTATLLTLALLAAGADAPGYHLLKTVPIPGDGGWDYLIADKMVTVNGRAFAFRQDLVKGFVIRNDANAVILRVDDKYYALHIGDDLDMALRKALTQDRLKALGLAKAAVPTAWEKKASPRRTIQVPRIPAGIESRSASRTPRCTNA